jgi:carboxyl-terminal processing protease
MIRLMLEGAPGSELTVSVVRPRKAAPDKITMTRAVSPLPPVGETMYENSSILYLKPVVLDHDHVQQVESKLKAMPKSGNKKILLDLRDGCWRYLLRRDAAGELPAEVGNDCNAGRAEGC